MALNPNIALGIQPVQQPNMLAQMGQIMALKAAQQETEGYEGVKGAITGGMDPADPRMMQFGKRGVDVFKAAGEARVKQQDALTKAYLNQRKSLDFVSTPDELLAHGLSQFNDPVIAPQLKAQGLTPKKLTASFQRQLATEGFESLLKKRAMGLDDWYKDQTSRRNTDVTAGVGYQRNALEREKWQYDIDNPKMTPLAGEKVDAKGDKVPAYFGYDPRTNSMVEVSMPTVSVGPISTVGAGTPVNALAPQAAPQAPSVNALTAPAAGAPTSPVMRPPVAGLPSAAAPSAAIPSAGSPTSVSGGVRFGPKSTAENLTESQGKSTGFAMRAKQASDILDIVGKDGKVQPGLIKRGAEAIPFIGEGLGTTLNVTQSDAQQKIEQAQRSFVNAIMRQESGAAINPSEWDNAKKQYFPQPGDGPGVIEQKRLNRKTAVESLEIAGGPGMKKVTSPIPIGTVEDGFKYKGGDPANKNNWEKQ